MRLPRPISRNSTRPCCVSKHASRMRNAWRRSSRRFRGRLSCWVAIKPPSSGISSEPAPRSISGGLRTPASSTISSAHAGRPHHLSRLYLRDVASCELAMAELRIKHKTRPSQPVAAGRAIRFRRNRDTVFLPCTYDIRPIFEGGPGEIPQRRDVTLAILVPPGTEQPAIFEVPAPVYALLVELDTWTRPGYIGADGGAGRAHYRISRDHGLLEVSP